MMVCGSPPSQSATPSMVVAPQPAAVNDPDPELHTFREAIALSGKHYSLWQVNNEEYSYYSYQIINLWLTRVILDYTWIVNVFHLQ